MWYDKEIKEQFILLFIPTTNTFDNTWFDCKMSR